MNNRKTRKSVRAFTLIELLVVVSIIALLVAILLPTLGKAKKRANTARCLANIRGLSQTLNVYMTDQQAQLPYDWNGGGNYWTMALNDYGNSATLMQCPEVTVNGSPDELKDWKAPSGPGLVSSGAYSINGWMEAPAIPPAYDWGLNQSPNPTPAPQTTWYWKYPYDGAQEANIPMVADALWPDAWPCEQDRPPQKLTQAATSLNGTMMRRFYVDRHTKSMNIAFADSHAENVPLGEKLWEFSWHRGWQMNLVSKNMPFPTQ